MAGAHADRATGDLRRSSCGATKRVMGCAEMNSGDACGLCHWDRRQSSYGATKRVRGAPKSMAGTHADCATVTFGGAPVGP
eukprot:7728296-Pyramimonas_sp.AAC.1